MSSLQMVWDIIARDGASPAFRTVGVEAKALQRAMEEADAKMALSSKTTAAEIRTALLGVTTAEREASASAKAMSAQITASMASMADASKVAAAKTAEADAAIAKGQADLAAKTEASSVARKKSLMNFGMGAAVILAGIGYESVKAASGFETAMARVQTMAGVSAGDLKKLSAGILDLAPKVGVGPDQLAESLYHVASSGVPASKAMDMVAASAKLARIGQDDLNSSTQAIVSTMASNIKGVRDANDAAALILHTVGQGDMTMHQFTQAIGTGLLPTAAAVGLSFRDVGAAIATMTDNAIPVDQAATKLRTSLLMMVNPSGPAASALASIGLASTALAGDLQKPDGLKTALDDIRVHLNKAFPLGSGIPLTIGAQAAAIRSYTDDMMSAGVSGKELDKMVAKYTESLQHGTTNTVLQEQAFSKMFGGSKNAGTMLVLFNEQLDRMNPKLASYGDATSRAAELQAAWAKQQDTFRQKLADLGATFDVMKIKVGNALLPALKDVFGFLADHTGLLRDAAVVIGVTLVGATAAWTAALLAALPGKVLDGFRNFKSDVVDIASGLKRATLATWEFIATNPGMLVAAAAVGGLVYAWRHSHDPATTFKVDIDGITDAVKRSRDAMSGMPLGDEILKQFDVNGLGSKGETVTQYLERYNVDVGNLARTLTSGDVHQGVVQLGNLQRVMDAPAGSRTVSIADRIGAIRAAAASTNPIVSATGQALMRMWNDPSVNVTTREKLLGGILRLAQNIDVARGKIASSAAAQRDLNTALASAGPKIDLVAVAQQGLQKAQAAADKETANISKSLQGQVDAFDGVKKASNITARALLDNAKAATRSLLDETKNIRELQMKGLDPTLIKQLADKGPEYIAAANTLSLKELKGYNSDVNKEMNAENGRSVAIRELGATAQTLAVNKGLLDGKQNVAAAARIAFQDTVQTAIDQAGGILKRFSDNSVPDNLVTKVAARRGSVLQAFLSSLPDPVRSAVQAALRHMDDFKNGVDVSGAAAALSARKTSADIQQAMQNLQNVGPINLDITAHGKVLFAGGDAQAVISGHHADGGFISGPGGPRTDSIPSWLSNGEYVINAAATARNRPLLDEINRHKFADGGPVGIHFMDRATEPLNSGVVAFVTHALNSVALSAEKLLQAAQLAIGTTPISYGGGGNTIGLIESLANSLGVGGLSVTSTYRPNAGYHGMMEAVDFSNGSGYGPGSETPGELAFNRAWAAKYGSSLAELIHAGAGSVNIKDGKVVDGWGFYGAETMMGHFNHVHVAISPASLARAGAHPHAFASGGMPQVGRPYWTGENGPELQVALGPTRVFSHEESKAMTRDGVTIAGDLHVHGDTDIDLLAKRIDFLQRAGGF